MGKIKTNKMYHNRSLRIIISLKLVIHKIIKISRTSITQVVRDIKLEETSTIIKDLRSLNSSTIKEINITNSSLIGINALHR